MSQAQGEATGAALREPSAGGAGEASPLLVREPVVTPLVAPAPRATASERVAIAIVWLGSLTLLVLASTIHPDGRGVGTHEQLGLPPCGVYQMTGYPCPSCGMTTSFAHAVRLHVWESIKAQPLGFVLACCALVASVLGPWAVWTGRPFLDGLSDRVSRRSGWIFLGAIVAAWAYKAAAVKGVFGS